MLLRLESCTTHRPCASSPPHNLRAHLTLLPPHLCLPHPQSALKDMLWPSLVIAAVRLVAIWLGSWMGCASTATLPEFRRVFWASMVTQVGAASLFPGVDGPQVHCLLGEVQVLCFGSHFSPTSYHQSIPNCL